jgi:hypothetical protein
MNSSRNCLRAIARNFLFTRKRNDCSRCFADDHHIQRMTCESLPRTFGAEDYPNDEMQKALAGDDSE